MAIMSHNWGIIDEYNLAAVAAPGAGPPNINNLALYNRTFLHNKLVLLLSPSILILAKPPSSLRVGPSKSTTKLLVS
jgi:hypothetical protein